MPSVMWDWDNGTCGVDQMDGVGLKFYPQDSGVHWAPKLPVDCSSIRAFTKELL